MILSPLVILCAGLSAHTLSTDDEINWPSFRGVHASGVADTDALPTEWDIESGKNIQWKVPVAGLAHSSPIIWGDKLYVTSAVRMDAPAELSSLWGSPGYGNGDSVDEEGKHAFRLHCLNKETGEELWARTVLEAVPEIKRHPKSTHANCSPAANEDYVVAFFGSDGLFCYDHEGNEKWKLDFGVLDTGAPRMENYEQYQWGFASSPVIHAGKVIVQCDIQEQSFLAVLDVATGKEVWRVERDEDPCWATPTVYESSAAGVPQIIVNGFKHIGGYEFESGKEIWKLVGGGDVPVPTPVVEHGLIFLTSAHGPLAPIYAIDAEKAKGELQMNPAECEAMAWSNRRGIYMQTPIVYGEELYTCSDSGILTCYDAGTGERHYRERLGDGRAGFSGSPVAGDGKLYFSDESGTVRTVQAGPDFELLGVNELGETLMATPAISEGRIYLRAQGHLYCISEE